MSQVVGFGGDFSVTLQASGSTDRAFLTNVIPRRKIGIIPMSNFAFGVTIENDSATGEVQAAYFQIRHGKVHQTIEYADGAATADYNRNGELLGIELLGPCRAAIVDQIAANESVSVRRETKRFMRQNGPRALVTA